MTTRWTVAATALALAALACGSEDSAPQIELVSPNVAVPGDTVEITGKRFCGPVRTDANDDGTCVEPPAGAVFIGAARASVQVWTQASIAVTVPTEVVTGQTTIVVERDGERSNPTFFDVGLP